MAPYRFEKVLDLWDGAGEAAGAEGDRERVGEPMLGDECHHVVEIVACVVHRTVAGKTKAQSGTVCIRQRG